MSTLHQIQHSNIESNALACCLRYIGQGDVILLVGNGVNTVLNLAGKALLNDKAFYLLEDDVIARGLSSHCQGLPLVTYEGFVSLTIKHEKVISW